MSHKQQLSRDQVLRVRQLDRQGVDAGMISERMGITKTHVKSIISKRVWKDVR